MGSRFGLLGEPYRAIFVDLDGIVAEIARALPVGARCLDVGGGDGAVANRLLRLRIDVHITIIDPAPNLGGFIDPNFVDRTQMRPGVALADMAAAAEPFDVVMLNDVVHHVPHAVRPAFFADLARLCRRAGCRRLLIKDVEPGSLRARLGLWSDLYIAGDRHVVQIGAKELKAMVEAAFGEDVAAFMLSVPDPPNYFARIDLN